METNHIIELNYIEFREIQMALEECRSKDEELVNDLRKSGFPSEKAFQRLMRKEEVIVKLSGLRFSLEEIDATDEKTGMTEDSTVYLPVKIKDIDDLRYALQTYSAEGMAEHSKQQSIKNVFQVEMDLEHLIGIIPPLEEDDK